MLYKDSSHTYTNEETEEQYISVTTLLGTLVPAEDWNLIAARYLKKRIAKGTLLKDLATKNKISLEKAEELWGDSEYTVEWLLELWGFNNKKATDGGSLYHLMKEESESVIDGFEYNPVVNDLKVFRDLDTLDLGTTYLELGIGSHKYKVWGQADKVIIHEDGTFTIRDYKTNQDRSKLDNKPSRGYDYNAKRSFVKKFNPPVSQLDDNKFNTYALQLSMYAYFLELYGYTCKELILEYVHTKFVGIDEDTSNLTVIHEDREFGRKRIIDDSKFENGIEPIPVPYLKREIKNIMKYRHSMLYNNGIF